MSTRPTESTHESEPSQPRPEQEPRNPLESPSADRLQGAAGLPHAPEATHEASRRSAAQLDRAKADALDPDSNESAGDQDIDTAGTDADPESPTKAMGTGIAPDRARG